MEKLYHQGNDKGDDEEWAEVDFVGFGLRDERKHDEASNEISKEESDECGPGVGEDEGEGGREEPVAVADPFAPGN